MRKILLVVIVVLLLALGYVTAVQGIEIGKTRILSIQQIEAESQSLKSKIEQANRLIDTEYPQKLQQLQSASSNFEDAKSEYLKYTNLSSDEAILEARTEKSYAIEFLWAKLGVHAKEEGVNLIFELVTSNLGANNVNDIKFTINGSYIAITNFIYAIENDSELDFRIQDFSLLPYKNDILQATFVVTNIEITGNTSTVNVQVETESTKQEENKTTEAGGNINNSASSQTSTQQNTQQSTQSNNTTSTNSPKAISTNSTTTTTTNDLQSTSTQTNNTNSTKQ